MTYNPSQRASENPKKPLWKRKRELESDVRTSDDTNWA